MATITFRPGGPALERPFSLRFHSNFEKTVPIWRDITPSIHPQVLLPSTDVHDVGEMNFTTVEPEPRTCTVWLNPMEGAKPPETQCTVKLRGDPGTEVFWYNLDTQALAQLAPGLEEGEAANAIANVEVNCVKK